MKKSKVIALSSVTTALCVIIIIAGAYIEIIDLTCLFMASLVLMIPLSKQCYWGCFLSYLATLILSLILTGGRFQIIIPFGMFFGLHPLVNELQKKYNINRILATIIKAIWFVGTCYIAYYFTKLFIVENEIIEKYINYIIGFGGAIFFVIYDYFMMRFQMMTNAIIERLKI